MGPVLVKTYMKGDTVVLHQWDNLSKLQLGIFAEQLFRNQFAMRGFEVLVPEVDERATDFVARSDSGILLDVQVKSIRGRGYVYLVKDKWPLEATRLLALALFTAGKPPDLFVIPSLQWKTPDDVFVSRDYEGKKSRPEWGLTISQQSRSSLARFAVEKQLANMSGHDLSRSGT